MKTRRLLSRPLSYLASVLATRVSRFFLSSAIFAWLAVSAVLTSASWVGVPRPVALTFASLVFSAVSQATIFFSHCARTVLLACASLLAWNVRSICSGSGGSPVLTPSIHSMSSTSLAALVTRPGAEPSTGIFRSQPGAKGNGGAFGLATAGGDPRWTAGSPPPLGEGRVGVSSGHRFIKAQTASLPAQRCR